MDMRPLSLSLSLTLLLLPVASLAQAQTTTPVYAGMSAGGYHIDGDDWNRESGVIGAKLGWQITDGTALELGFNHFADALDITILGLDANLELNATTLAVVQRYAFPSERCRIFWEAGGYYWESELALENTSIIGIQMNDDELELVTSDYHFRDKEYGTDAFAGFGLQIRHGAGHLNSRIAARYYHWKHDLLDDFSTRSIATVTYDLLWHF